MVQELENMRRRHHLPYRGYVEMISGVPTFEGVAISALFLAVPVTDCNKTVPFIVGTYVNREYNSLHSYTDDIPET